MSRAAGLPTRRSGTLRRLGPHVGLAAALLILAVLAVGLGSVWLPPSTVLDVVGHHVLGTPAEATWTPAEDNIVWLVRVPRALLAATVGAALAMAGVTIQAMVRNPLADPHLLGVTSGATAGAAAAILLGLGGGLGATALSSSAFLGALAATGVVFLVARIGGTLTPLRLVLAGVAVGYALSAVTSFLIVAADTRDGARAVLFWLLGSLDQARWSTLWLPAAVVSSCGALLWLANRWLDALVIGDETAHTLGVSPARARAALFAVLALSVGSTVAVSGAIGFVGLIIPHLARRLAGGEHRRILPVAALLGAVLLVAADLVARVTFPPREVPVGIVTALIGAPWLIALIRRTREAPA